METENVAPTEVPEGAYLIDVREQGEWDAGHAPDAHHLPASSLLENLDKLPEDDQDLYIVCRTGGRSIQVAQWLNNNGFDAINVSGGMDLWLESDLPVVADEIGRASCRERGESTGGGAWVRDDGWRREA